MYDKHLRRVVSESYKWKNLLKPYEYMKIICELRVIRNFCSCEKKAWKKKISGLYGIRTLAFCDAGAALYQLS